MNKDKLDNLVKIGSLVPESADADEVESLVDSGSIKLKDAELLQLSLESRFNLAYNASHSLALAALRQCGYRSKNRYLVFQCFEHTLDIPAAQWRPLADAYSKRNNAEYEGVFDVSQKLVVTVIAVAKQILEKPGNTNT